MIHGMDAIAKLGEAETLVHGGRRVGSRSLVDREALLERLIEVRELMTAELREAAEVVRDRDAIVEEGRRAAERLRLDVEAERTRRLSDTEAGSEARRLVTEASDFAERSLAELEAVLQRVLSAISRARDRLVDGGTPIGADGLRQALEAEPPQPESLSPAAPAGSPVEKAEA